MPRKNKKKQRKEERRKAMQRVRQEKGWQPPPEEEFPDDELARDLLAFLPGLGQAGEAIEATTADTLTTAVLETDDLADEPEFREIYFHPLQAIDLYAELEEERGVTEEVLDALSEDQEDELFFDLMVEIARGLLTTELQDHILDAMDAAWRRVRREGDQENAGRLAAMLSLLGSDEGVEMWPVAGLVQAILRRSLEAGFEIVAALDSAGPEDMGIRSLWQSVRNESVEQQIEAIIARYPGLSAVMTEGDEQAWSEGLQALAEGELYLGFFRAEELEQAGKILTPEELGEPGTADEELGRAGIEAMKRYIAGLLTLERRAEMREQLLTMLEDEALAGEWHSFLTLLLYELDDDSATPPVFLSAAMIGELADMSAEDDGAED